MWEGKGQYLFFLFSQHELPSLKCSEEDCLADFVLRKDARLNNPGSNRIPKLKLQEEKEYLVQCGHLLALMKNKAKKHFTDTGKFGWRKSIKH